jgi:hypothetical protein
MIRHTTAKQVADRENWAQNCIYEANHRISCSRQSSKTVGERDRKELVQLYSSAAGQETSRREKTHGFLEEEKARQIFKAFASSAGSSPCPSARIAVTKSSSFLKYNISRKASSRCFLSFSASASLGRRPLRRSSFMSDVISSSLRSLSMVIRRYSNSFVPDLPVFFLRLACLTMAAGRRYTGVSRWERISSRRASCHSTRRSSGLPSGIYELNLTSTGSLLPLCAAPRTYEQR